MINNTGVDNMQFSSHDSNIVSFDDNDLICANTVGETVITCENGGYVAECEIIVVDPNTYSAGISANDINAEFVAELIDDNTISCTFRDIVPEGRVQTQVHMNLYYEDFEDASGNTVSWQISEGLISYEETNSFELNGKSYIYLDGEVIIDGQIIKIEKQRFDFK